jgi:hypothetical protein
MTPDLTAIIAQLAVAAEEAAAVADLVDGPDHLLTFTAVVAHGYPVAVAALVMQELDDRDARRHGYADDDHRAATRRLAYSGEYRQN